jgi:hypothetical protein
MTPSSLLRLASSVTSLAADAVEGKPPSPTEIIALLAGAATALGVSDELHHFLTVEAKARVDAEIDAKIDGG